MENFETFKLDQTGQQTQEILDQVSTNTADIAQLRALYEALTQSEPIIIQPSDTWPVADPQENVIYRVIDRVNTPPQSYSDYMWNGTAMVLMATYNNSIDNEPTPGSNNLVKSGGVAASIVFDISAYHATGSTLATYADLASALGNDGANVPASVRKGGMSVKFVGSSDSKYVQYRYMGTAITGDHNPFLDVDNWEGVDNLPVMESPNLVRSGGVSKEIGINIDGGSSLLSGTWMSDQGNWYQDYPGMHATPKIICYGKKPYISGAIFDYCCGWKQDGTFLGVENIHHSLDWSQVYEFAFCFVDANNIDGYSDLHVTTGMKKDIDNLYAEDVTLNNKADRAYYNTGIYLKGSSELLGGYWHPENGAYVSSGDWKSTPKLICDGNKPYIEGVISNYFCGWKKDGTFLGIENKYQSLDWSQVYEFTHNFVVADNPAGFDNLRVVTEIGHTVIDIQDTVNVTHTGASQLLNGAWMPDTGLYNVSQSGYKCTPKYKCNGVEPYIAGAKWRLLMRYDSNGDYIGFNDYGEVIDWESATWFSIDFETQENPNGFNNLVIICGLKGESKKHGNRISDLELKDFYSETICCDGDSLTYGTLGISQTDDQAEHNYPSVLQSHLGSKFHIINCGMPGAQSTTILGNATGYRIRTPFTIPATKNTRVAFKAAPFRNIEGLSNVYSYGPWFSQGLEAMCNPAYIGDVKVKLVPQTTIAPDTEEYSQLIRYEDGDAFDVKEGDILLTNEALSNVKTMAHHIIFMGQNGGWVKEGESIHSTDSINELVSQYKNLIKASNVLYICISSHKWNSSSGTGAWEGETIFANEFGIHYINLRKYMAEDAIQDAIDRGYLPDDGTYPTAADSAAMANGQCPPSLLHDVEGDRIHFTDVGYHLFGDLVYSKFKELYKARILGTL